MPSSGLDGADDGGAVDLATVAATSATSGVAASRPVDVTAGAAGVVAPDGPTTADEAPSVGTVAWPVGDADDTGSGVVWTTGPAAPPSRGAPMTARLAGTLVAADVVTDGSRPAGDAPASAGAAPSGSRPTSGSSTLSTSAVAPGAAVPACVTAIGD
jgi:hypothetical protein